MVPVGDRHRSRAGQGHELGDVLARVALGLGDPQPMPDVVCVAEVDGGRSRGDRREDRRARPGRILVEANDGRRVDPGRAQQAIPILARALQGALVGEHAGLRTERLESQPAEEAALRPLRVGAWHAVRLLVDIDRGPGFLVERPIRAPRSQGPCRAAVPFVGLVAGRDAGQVQAHDVLRVTGQKTRGLLGADHVVWRRHDRGKVADRLGVVAQGTKRTDFGHGLPQASAIGGGHEPAWADERLAGAERTTGTSARCCRMAIVR